MTDPKSESSTSATPKFLILRNCEIIHVYCFKLLRLGDINYAIVDNEYNVLKTLTNIKETATHQT